MKWVRFLLSAFLCVPLFAKGPEQNTGIYDFSKGLDTYHSSLSLPDGFVQDSQNVLFDDKAPVTKRKGYTVVFSSKSYAYQSTWAYTDSTNTSWIIVRASDSLIASNLAGVIVRISTVSANDVVGESNAFGNAYFVDPTQAVYFWNGSSTTYVAGSPHGNLITQFHSRLWVSGAAPPNGSQVYSSGFLSGTNWNLGPNATDPVQLTAGLQDNFDNVTAMYAYLDTLYIFKHYSIYSLSGFDQTSFLVSFVSSECGCIDQNSVQTFGGALKFVSLRGVENFDGYRCTRISDPIKDKVDPAIQVGSFSQSSWVQSQQADWQAGTINPSGSLNLTIETPNVVLSTGVFVDTTAVSFNLGTFSHFMNFPNDFSSPVDGSLSLFNFITSPLSSLSGWTTNAGSWSTSSGYLTATANFSNLTQPLANTAHDSGIGSLILYFEILGSCALTGDTEIDLLNSGNNGNGIQAATQNNGNINITPVTVVGGNVTNFGNVTSFSCDSNWHQIAMKISYSSNAGIFIDGSQVDTYTGSLIGSPSEVRVTNGSSTNGPGIRNVQVSPSSGTFTSRVFDTGISSPVIQFQYGSSGSQTLPSLDLRTASSASGPFVELIPIVSSGVVYNQQSNRYLMYSSTFTKDLLYNALPSLNGSAIFYSQSSGTLTTQTHNVGAINTWGNFAVSDIPNNGNIGFTICSSSSASMSPKSCATQTANSQIVIATNTFVQWSATFTVTAATQTPTLVSGTVQWFSGSKSIPMASTVWDNRYWLSLTTSTADSSNDAILVLANSGAWADLDIHASGLAQYKNSLYHSDSLPTGNVYLDNQGYMDNGVPINAYIKTKDYTQGDLTEDNFLEEIWPSMDNSGPYNVTVNYFPDRVAAGFPLGQVAMSEFANDASAKMQVPIDSAHQVFGKSMAYFFQASDANSPWNFYGLKEIYRTRPPQ